jgi:NAD dependent epimerase/dehydratase
MKKSKKILITGAGGFIGSHLVEKCLENGFRIRAFVHYNSRNSWGWLEKLKNLKDIEIFSGDVRDLDSIKKAVDDCGTVFHLAALIGIPYSYVSPMAYIKTNIEGTYNILEACRETGCENIIVTSTSETYGTAQYVPIDEKHPAVGQSPYSASKIAADQLAISYHRSFDLPVKIVRPFNTYGPRQSARAIIPTIITQILKGKKKLELGNIAPTRDLTFVKDTVNAFLEIAKYPLLNGKAINIGMNDEISIEALAMMIAEIIGEKIEIIKEKERIRPGSSEVERLRCDNTLLISQTKWKPEYNLKKGLTETIEWISRNLHAFKSDIYNV